LRVSQADSDSTLLAAVAALRLSSPLAPEKWPVGFSGPGVELPSGQILAGNGGEQGAPLCRVHSLCLPMATVPVVRAGLAGGR